MAGRDLPGPNSLDRKTKFQRNFNQLWWESEREREGRGRRAGSGGRAGREVGEGWLVLQRGCSGGALGCGDSGDSVPAFPMVAVASLLSQGVDLPS